MSTLVIRKKSLKTWEHYLDDKPLFISSKFFFNTPQGFKFQIVEEGKATLGAIAIEDITLYDDSTGGGAETFASVTELSIRLEALDYTGHYRNGDISVGSLISADAGNDLELGTDGLLYVVAGGGGGGSFDPTVDQIGLIDNLDDTPILSDDTVNVFANKTQGQIEGLLQRNPYQITQKFNLAPFPPDGWTVNDTPTWDGTKVIFDFENMDLITPYVNNPTTVSFDLERETFDIVDIVQFRFQVSLNTGITWTTLETYTEAEITLGFPTLFTVDLSAYSNQYELLFRFTKTDGTINAIYLDNFNLKYELPIAQFASDIASINFDLESVLENEILENALGWAVPPSTGAYGSSYTPIRQVNVIIVQNNSSDSFFGPMVAPFETTNVAGTGGGRRRCDSLNFNSFQNFVFVNDFRVDNNISNDCRYIVGLSKNYQFAFPTNNDPSVHTECIYVAKLATSNNLHIVHNDNAGTATTIDLGANFPANSNLYKYRFYLTKRSASDYDVQIFRRTLATGVVLASSIYNLTTNLPTSGGVLQQIMYINNNATATNMRLGDYGFINKFLPL